MKLNINCKIIAEEIKEKVKMEISKQQICPQIHIIEIDSNYSSSVYLNGKLKDCEEVGIDTHHIKFPPKISTSELIDYISLCNSNDICTGISIQFPLPSHLNKEKVIRSISYKKDIDGFRAESPYRACTAKAVAIILDSLGVDLSGKHCVIIGRSEIVGKPLIDMMLQRNMTVTICHSYTYDIPEYTIQADVLVSAAGVPNLINGKMVKQNVIAIDVGTNIGSDGRLCGDFYFPGISSKASFITTVPGGVGLVTRAVFINNILEAMKKNQGEQAFEI